MTTVRTVHDPAPLIGASFCLKSLPRVEHKVRLCCLHRDHLGECLPWPTWGQSRVPRPDVSDSNPPYVPAPRRAS